MIAENVHAVYRAADADISAPPGAGELAQRLLGPAALRFTDRLAPGEAHLTGEEDCGWTLSTARGASPEMFSLAAARGIARFAERTKIISTGMARDEEFVACLLIPPAAFDRVRLLGDAEIAWMFVVDTSVVAIARRAGARRSGTFAVARLPFAGVRG